MKPVPDVGDGSPTAVAGCTIAIRNEGLVRSAIMKLPCQARLACPCKRAGDEALRRLAASKNRTLLIAGSAFSLRNVR